LTILVVRYRAVANGLAEPDFTASKTAAANP
jgi:hypothetical protein